MVRHFTEGKLVIASHNAGKVREIDALLAPYGAKVVSAGALGLAEPIEDGASFIANAEIKARAAARAAGLPALADDSGLAVPVLGGAPGIHSARWAGPEKDFGVAMARVWRELAERETAGRNTQEHRRARLACALSLCWPAAADAPEHVETFEGSVHGHLVWPPRGTRGFGYDPMFVADGYAMTFGEIDPDEKHRVSHRAAAFRLLVGACFE